MDVKVIVFNILLIAYDASASDSEQYRQVHHLMTENELSYYFGSNYNNTQIPSYEIINLPKHIWHEQENGNSLNFTIDAWKRPISFNLQKNNNLVSRNFRTVVIDENGSHEIDVNDSGCHLLHRDDIMAAALSNCNHEELIGLIFMPNLTLEVKPLTDRLKSIMNATRLDDTTVPHIIRKFNVEDEQEINSNSQLSTLFRANNTTVYAKKDFGQNRARRPNIEVACFFDEAAYRTFAPYFKGNNSNLRDMILAYMNGIQAVYHHPSLRTKVDITIVYLEIMKIQPNEMPHYNGERGELLDSFCKYQKDKNPKNDSNPQHWDMALYISGLDFYSFENGRQNGLTMGLATVGGVCYPEYACVIAEFGTTNLFGRPYPSAGFTSVYILAHEIGHNLGMHHDSSGNNCPKEGFIMSPSRGTNGEVTWSGCSSDVASKLDKAKCLFDEPASITEEFNAWKFKGFPGQTWTAKKQCELLLTDRDAYVATHDQHNMCFNLHCRTPNRSGYYLSGPALDGTECGKEKWCQGGECISKSYIINHFPSIKGGWSAWKNGHCESACITKSKGAQKRTRECNNPEPVNTDDGCQGISYDIRLCNDDKLCGGPSGKISPSVYASQKCKEFSDIIFELDPNGKGLQAGHEYDRVWMSCAIFCKRKDSNLFYTPRFELNDLGIAAYFPDGTLCHTEKKLRYYCRHHHCLPEKFEITKSPIWQFDEDIPITANTKSILAIKSNKNIEKYFSIDNLGKPLLTKLSDNDLKFFDEEDWTDKDYIDL